MHMQLGSSISLFAAGHGVATRFSHDPFPSELARWSADRLALGSGATHFGYVHEGTAVLTCGAGRFELGAGMYFAAVDASAIAGGRGVVISRLGYRGLFQIGGPIEDSGRLRYIDGCTDTLLIAPPMLGDPCLNLLCIPPGTRQSAHTHPSLRAGMVVAGRGRCVTPRAVHPLHAGDVFAIPAGCEHSFHTDAQVLRVIAYHPDSDCGPTHEDHPMRNRTILSRPAAGDDRRARMPEPGLSKEQR